MLWKPLPLSSTIGNQVPSLLVATAFKKNTYTIHLTDLTSLWTETLDHAALLRRSREENTSIDPNEDDQLTILLDKIQHGIVGEGSGTTLGLFIHNENDRPTLTLNVTVNLPGGLAPLKWPIFLAPASQTQFSNLMVLPLLRAQHARLQEILGLKEVLAEKDHVIQKVVDKLEAQGTDLGEVFPQAAAVKGRKVDRKRAEGRVKGMGAFEEELWKKSLRADDERDIGVLIGEIFAGGLLKIPILGPSETKDVEDEENWWEGIKGININLKTGKFSTRSPTKKKSKLLAPPLPPSIPKEDTEDGAFQVQSTPPGRSLPAVERSRSPSRPIHHDDTTDDEDHEVSSQISRVIDSFSVQAAYRPRSPKASQALNHFRNKKSTPLKAGPKLSAPPPRLLNDQIDDDATEDEALQSSPSSRVRPASQTKSPSPPLSRLRTPARRTKSPSPLASSPPKRGKLGNITNKARKRIASPAEEPPPMRSREATWTDPTKPKKAKLGKIGGKKETTAVPEPLPAEVDDHEDPVAQFTTLRKKKLGIIGRHISDATPAASSERVYDAKDVIEDDGEDGKDGNSDDGDGVNAKESSRGRATMKVETPPPPKNGETSQERADRKRVELKREIEAKAKAPARKKRKF